MMTAGLPKPPLMTSPFCQFVDVCGVATQVLCFGANIFDRVRPDRLVLFIPGNPGVVGFYEHFLSRLYTELGGSVSVWAVGHAGHCLPDGGRDQHSDELQIDTLSGQIDHKRAFISRYISPLTQVFLVGHSIGAYMCVHLSSEARPITIKAESTEADVADGKIVDKIEKLQSAARVSRNFAEASSVQVQSGADAGQVSYGGQYLLFPTLHRMRTSPQGRRWWPLLQYGIFTAVLMSHLVKLLFPSFLLRWLCGIYLYFCCGGDRPYLSPSSTSTAAAALQGLMQTPQAIGHALKVARDELLHVCELEDCCQCLPVAARRVPTLMYWGTRDDWAPLSYTVPVTEIAPEANLVVCKHNLAHCFSLSLFGSRICADNVADWLRSST